MSDCLRSSTDSKDQQSKLKKKKKGGKNGIGPKDQGVLKMNQFAQLKNTTTKNGASA